MNSAATKPGPGGQILGAELRRLRELAGVSGRRIATRVGISQPTVSRIESGASVPSIPMVMAWGEALGVSPKTRKRLRELTEVAHEEANTWRVALRDGGHLQDDVRRRETLADRVRVFQPSVVPGLLQTAEYARRVFSMFQVPYSPSDLEDAIAGRMRRQGALYDPDRQFDFLITEAALRWRPGPRSLLLAQLEQLAHLSALDSVSIGLIPLNVTAVTFTSHGFVIYDSDEAAPFVSVDTIHSNVAVNDPGDVELYQRRWKLLDQMALLGEEADRFLAKVIAEVGRGLS